MSEKTLIQLIDEIVHFGHHFEETHDKSHILMINDRASILGDRLGCSTPAAMCFAFILSEAAWGRLPARSDIMKFLPENTTMADRLECLWELLDKKLVQIYKPARSPIRQFYIDQEVAEKIVANRVPCTNNSLLFPAANARKVCINASCSGKDYEILLEGSVVGFILMSAINETYEVYWKGLLVHAAEDLSSIVEWLNEAYDNGTLKSSQI